MIAMRKLGSTDKSAATVFYFTVAGALSGLVFVPAHWVTPTPEDLALLVAIGLVGGVAQIFMTEAFRLAPPSVVAPFDYTAMLWALAFGFFVFGTFPAPERAGGRHADLRVGPVHHPPRDRARGAARQAQEFEPVARYPCSGHPASPTG